jgi:UDP-N-acetylmuramoyl-tripeptide--D-alanyl-D-alanine ligase
MTMGTLTMAAAAMQGTLFGDDCEFDAISTDTRELQPGELFFALRGERFDAMSFVKTAAQIGAAAAVVERRQTGSLAQIEVADTRNALGQLARDWRSRFNVPVIGITGSNGKTTCKEMLASILRAGSASENGNDDAGVLVTDGNLNNEIGLPLTLLRQRETHRVCVCEMGASKRGDIAYLAAIAAPTIGIVTNAGAAHLEGFGDEDGVAATKGELFAALGEGGVAIINRDDAHFETWCKLAGRAEVLSFGLHPDADYRASEIIDQVTGGQHALTFKLHTPAGQHTATLPMAGRHNVMNALAACSAAQAAGVSVAAVLQGLATASNVAGRLRGMTGSSGMALFDDSYNANPVSVRAAIDFLAERHGETWLVLGDMAELGDDSLKFHREIGEHARQSGIARLFCFGMAAAAAADSFGVGAQTFDDIDALADAIRANAHARVTTLVKGSRCMRLDRLVASLRVESERTPSGARGIN